MCRHNACVERRRQLISLSTVALLCSLATTVAFAGSATAQATAPSSAVKLLGTAMRDAAAKGSVHETARIRSNAAVVTDRDDVGQASGRQIVASSNGATSEVLVVNGLAYFDGNQAALRSLYDLSPTAAVKVGARWVSVPTSDSLYPEIVGDVTLPSALQEVTPGGHLTETAPTKVDGTPVIGIHGTAPADAGGGSITLYVSRSGAPLPVTATQPSTNGVSSRSTFTGWGEGLVVTAPRRSVSITEFVK